MKISTRPLTDQQFKRCVWLALTGIIITYILLFTKYYIYYVDDSWFMSRALGYWNLGVTEDFLFRTPDAPDRKLLFEKTYYWFSCQVLNTIGWSKGNAHLISIFFITLNAAVWYLILNQLKFSKQLKFTYSLFLLILPAFFSAANVARPDVMALFFASLSLFLFQKKWYLFSALILMIGLESHLMGLTGGFYILAYFISRWQYFLESWKVFFRMALPFLFGLLLGVSYYYLLHQNEFSFELMHTILTVKKEMKGPITNYYLRYFIQGFWYRHFWEIFFIGLGIYLYIKNKLWQQDPFVFIFALVMLASSFITSRPNWHYMIFAYPSVLLITCYAYEKAQLFGQMIKTIAIVLFLLYGAHFYCNHDYHFDEIMHKTREAMPKSDIPIIGMPDFWFAKPQQTFYPIYTSVKYIPDLDIPECYLIRSPYISHWSKNYQHNISYIETNYTCEILRVFMARNEDKIQVEYCKRN